MLPPSILKYYLNNKKVQAILQLLIVNTSISFLNNLKLGHNGINQKNLPYWTWPLK